MKLRCFVVIDLKKGEFKPEYAGKMNFYLSVVDDQLRHKSDAPSIGLILCQDRNHIIAEYALRGVSKPIGVSEYELTRSLPPEPASPPCRQWRRSKPNSPNPHQCKPRLPKASKKAAKNKNAGHQKSHRRRTASEMTQREKNAIFAHPISRKRGTERGKCKVPLRNWLLFESKVLAWAVHSPVPRWGAFPVSGSRSEGQRNVYLCRRGYTACSGEGVHGEC